MRIFETLRANRERIEAAYGGPLEWQPLDGRRACRIRHNVKGGYQDQERWPEVQDAMIEAMIRFEQSLKPHLDQLTT